jgi:hypothetical protein
MDNPVWESAGQIPLPTVSVEGTDWSEVKSKYRDEEDE